MFLPPTLSIRMLQHPFSLHLAYITWLFNSSGTLTNDRLFLCLTSYSITNFKTSHNLYKLSGLNCILSLKPYSPSWNLLHQPTNIITNTFKVLSSSITLIGSNSLWLSFHHSLFPNVSTSARLIHISSIYIVLLYAQYPCTPRIWLVYNHTKPSGTLSSPSH